MPRWSNWSGLVRASPRRIESARDEAHVQSIVREAAAARETIRVVGEGHSHAPLVAHDGMILDVDALSGVRSIDAGARVARIGAGARLHALGEPLRAGGVALLNQGDIDRQALAGAVATGTHGTGVTLQNLSAGVVGLRLVLADGSVVECDGEREPELFSAARLGLGAFGVVTEVALRVRGAYRLRERMWAEPIEEVLGRLDELVHATRHFEFFWVPGKPKVACKALAETDAPAIGPLGPEGARLSWSHEVLANTREDKHIEMEYSVPAEHGVACFRRLRALVEADFPELAWPLELRTLAADDVWMSTAYERPTITLSVHQGASEPYEALFAACEDVFREFDGRPHWGKAHGRTGRDLARLHPRWDDWWRVRDHVDPDGRFMNETLRGLRGDG